MHRLLLPIQHGVAYCHATRRFPLAGMVGKSITHKGLLLLLLLPRGLCTAAAVASGFPLAGCRCRQGLPLCAH